MGQLWTLKRHRAADRNAPDRVAAATCILAIAARGSSPKPVGASASSSYTNELTIAECMRSHGVPNFPDPAPPGASLTGTRLVALRFPQGSTSTPQRPNQH
jgi:hypothetical protein